MTRDTTSDTIRGNRLVTLDELDWLDRYLVDFGLEKEALISQPIQLGANLFPSRNVPGHLCIGLPNGFCNKSPFVANRLYWFPNGVPESSSVFIASSRLTQNLEDWPSWFDAIRTFACRVDAESQFLITAENISTDCFVKRLGQLFRIRVCEFRPLPPKIRPSAIVYQQDGEHICLFSEQLGPKKQTQKIRQADLDRLLMLASAEVRLLAVKKNGNTSKAANERIKLKMDTRVLIDHRLTPKNKLQDLLEQGATGWWVYDNDEHATESVEKPSCSAPMLEPGEINMSNYLLHWTRRRVGKWPNQSESQYLDDLIFGSSRARHDPIASLCRILATDRIFASNQLTRSQTPVVCLSEVTAENLPEMQVFRPHLARWDCLPFGIAIERKLLQSLGAQKVVYGDEATWESLTDEERPWFQTASSVSGNIDWRAEQEWRIFGDLDLRQIGNQQAFVFVPSVEAAEVVSQLSRWPVVVLGDQ